MSDPKFRQAQLDGVRQQQVEAVNALCDRLSNEGGGEPGEQRVPYIAPHYDARSARILVLLSNPGPKSGGDRGSGMLSFENDDASAVRMSSVYEAVGLDGGDAFPWNAYPWHVHEKHLNGLPRKLVVAGLDALHRVLQAAPNVRAIIAHGGDAHRSARMLGKDPRYRGLVAERGLCTFETRHTSNRAFIAQPGEREQMMLAMCEVYREAMRGVGLTPRSAPGPSDMSEADARWLRTTLADPRMIAHLQELEASRSGAGKVSPTGFAREV